MAVRFPVEIFPILSVISTFVGLSITYGVAVGLHHIQPFVPYISFTGTYGPENGIFTIVMFIITVLFQIFLLIRFKQISNGNDKKGARRIILHIINWVSVLCGVVSGVGTLIIGSYRVTDDKFAHNLGVHIGLGFIMIYILVQTAVGPFIRPRFQFRRLILVIRIIIIIFMVGSGAIFMGVTVNKLEKIHFIRKNLSEIMEWVMYGLIEIFFLTFVPEFRKLNLVFHFEFKEDKKIRMKYSINESENKLNVKLLENY